MPNTIATTTTHLSHITATRLRDAISDAAIGRGFGWVRDNVLRPHGVRKLSQLSDDQLCDCAARIIGAIAIGGRSAA